MKKEKSDNAQAPVKSGDRFYVFSTMTAPQRYTLWRKRVDEKGSEPRHREHDVVIKGGANAADKYFFTPRGVMTEVSADQMALLQQNRHFLIHQKKGFLTVVKSREDVDVVVKDMRKKDQSAPMVPKKGEKDPLENPIAV